MPRESAAKRTAMGMDAPKNETLNNTRYAHSGKSEMCGASSQSHGWRTHVDVTSGPGSTMSGKGTSGNRQNKLSAQNKKKSASGQSALRIGLTRYRPNNSAIKDGIIRSNRVAFTGESRRKTDHALQRNQQRCS